jgi:hypothetical protein
MWLEVPPRSTTTRLLFVKRTDPSCTLYGVPKERRSSLCSTRGTFSAAVTAVARLRWQQQRCAKCLDMTDVAFCATDARNVDSFSVFSLVPGSAATNASDFQCCASAGAVRHVVRRVWDCRRFFAAVKDDRLDERARTLALEVDQQEEDAEGQTTGKDCNCDLFSAAWQNERA